MGDRKAEVDSGNGMDAGHGRKSRAAGALAALALGAALSACAIREGSTDSPDGTGIVITVTDSSKVDLDFSRSADSVFRDSGDFDLRLLRNKFEDKDVPLGTVAITGLQVSYDDSTRSFLQDNEGVPFVLRLYLKDLSSDTASSRLTLESRHTGEGVLALDPDRVLFKLNEEIFGVRDGMDFLLGALQDTQVQRVRVIAEVRMLQPLRKAGRLRLNLVVDVAGKV